MFAAESNDLRLISGIHGGKREPIPSNPLSHMLGAHTYINKQIEKNPNMYNHF